jgi:hypothetical protein
MEINSMLKILNQKMSIKKFIKYVDDTKVRRKVKQIVLHHTSSSLDIWKGSNSMLHYYNLYNSRGWKAGPHIFIAPDGIWLFTPIKDKGRTSIKEMDKDAINIEIVGRYFDKQPDHTEICLNAAVTVSALIQKFGLTLNDVTNHYSFDPEGNCSKHTNQDWIANQITSNYNLIQKLLG